MIEEKREAYFLFGRKSYPQPLEYVGVASRSELEELEAESGEWIELIAFPQAAAIQVLPELQNQ